MVGSAPGLTLAAAAYAQIWVGSGVPSDMRPLNVQRMVSLIVRGTANRVGVSPEYWLLARDEAAELAHSCAEMGGIRSLNGKPIAMTGEDMLELFERGEGKICDVPIRLRTAPNPNATEKVWGMSQSHPALLAMLEKAATAKVGDIVTGKIADPIPPRSPEMAALFSAASSHFIGVDLINGDTARGPNHSEPSAELHPPPEHDSVQFHWLEGDDGKRVPVMWFRSRFCAEWYFPGNPRSRQPANMKGYHYLGPAEWDAASDREQVILSVSAEMLQAAVKRIAELEADVQRLRTRCHDADFTILALQAENATLRAAMADAKPDGGPKADYHGPNDQAHRAVHDVTEHLLGGRVSDVKARRGLRDALDKADKPATGRASSDGAVGRALRCGAPQIGMRLP